MERLMSLCYVEIVYQPGPLRRPSLAVLSSDVLQLVSDWLKGPGRGLVLVAGWRMRAAVAGTSCQGLRLLVWGHKKCWV